jgi:hypothetical protein
MTRYALVSAPRASALPHRGSARRRLGRLALVDHGPRVGEDAEASIIDRHGAADLRIPCESSALVARNHKTPRAAQGQKLPGRGGRQAPRVRLTEPWIREASCGVPRQQLRTPPLAAVSLPRRPRYLSGSVVADPRCCSRSATRRSGSRRLGSPAATKQEPRETDCSDSIDPRADVRFARRESSSQATSVGPWRFSSASGIGLARAA